MDYMNQCWRLCIFSSGEGDVGETEPGGADQTWSAEGDL